jgi:beta-lactamase class A
MRSSYLIAFGLAGLMLGAAPLDAQSNPLPKQWPKEKPDRALERELGQAVAGFHGKIGVYVRQLRTGRTAAINADSVFPTASMIKVPILIATFDAIQRGALHFNDSLTYRDSLLYPGGDILGMAKDSSAIDLSRVIMLMVTMSDNTAALWLQRLAGTGTAINDWLARNGFDSTRMNSRTPGRQADWQIYGWGQTTPREMARLLTMIRDEKAVSPAASQQMYRTLTRIYWNGQALSQIPPWVQAASKSGAVDASRSEVVLVNAPSGDYVFSVITKDNADTTWAQTNEAWMLTRKISALLWARFEPKHPWHPAPGAELLAP